MGGIADQHRAGAKIGFRVARAQGKGKALADKLNRPQAAFERLFQVQRKRLVVEHYQFAGQAVVGGPHHRAVAVVAQAGKGQKRQRSRIQKTLPGGVLVRFFTARHAHQRSLLIFHIASANAQQVAHPRADTVGTDQQARGEYRGLLVQPLHLFAVGAARLQVPEAAISPPAFQFKAGNQVHVRQFFDPLTQGRENHIVFHDMPEVGQLHVATVEIHRTGALGIPHPHLGIGALALAGNQRPGTRLIQQVARSFGQRHHPSIVRVWSHRWLHRRRLQQRNPQLRMAHRQQRGLRQTDHTATDDGHVHSLSVHRQRVSGIEA